MWGMEGCLAKVGGVVTEMYRTGHSHACSINLSAYCCRSCRGAHTERRGALLLGRSCQIQQLFLTDQRPPSKIPFGTKKQNRNGVTFSLSQVGFHRAVKTPLTYHELFGCYVPSLWTLRTVRTDCSSIYQ